MECKEKDCKKSPGFNYENEKTRLYCKLHKKPGMVDIKTKKCIENNCRKQPAFNYKNEQKSIKAALKYSVLYGQQYAGRCRAWPFRHDPRRYER